MHRRSILGLFIIGSILSVVPAVAREQKSIILASTTSTEQSGLLQHILPRFRDKTGIEVLVIALGTGQALDAARRGDADVVLVHDREAEEQFVAAGFGVDRREVMYNDFILVGPKDEATTIAGSKDITAALKQIAANMVPFVSRGDRSGTQATELRLWKDAAVDPNRGQGTWYRETGSGMALTLNTAATMNAYTLTDRGSWISFMNRCDLVIVVEGDQRLLNQYGVMLVNPAKHPHVRKDFGMAFVDWITSPEGQKCISDYKIGGEQLFFPNYKRNGM